MEEEAQSSLSWGRRLQAENLHLREKVSRLERRSRFEIPEAFRDAEDRRRACAKIEAASGVQEPPAIAPTASAIRNARALLREHYPDASRAAAENMSTRGPPASSRIAAQTSPGRVNMSEHARNEVAKDRQKGPLVKTLELRKELEGLLQLERVIQAENRELIEAMNSAADEANVLRTEAINLRKLAREPTQDSEPQELLLIRSRLAQKRAKVKELRRRVEIAALMERATEGLGKVLREVLPERILQTVIARWYDLVYKEREKEYVIDRAAQGLAAFADVLDDSGLSSGAPSPRRAKSPISKKRAERRARAGGAAATFEEGAGAGATAEEGFFTLSNAAAVLGNLGLDESGAALATFFGVDDEEDDGTGEWHNVWGEDDSEAKLEKRKDEYLEADNSRAQDQLNGLMQVQFAKRRDAGARAGAQDRKEARRRAAARKKTAASAAVA